MDTSGGSGERRKTVVFDVDNTLVDSNERFRKSLEEVAGRPVNSLDDLNPEERRRFWEVFLSPKYIELDKPLEKGISEIRDRAEKGYYIVILTGRPERLRIHTEMQLRKFGVPFHKLIMRSDNDYRQDYEYKVEKLGMLQNDGHEVVEFHEDLDRTVEAVRKTYPWIRVCHHKMGSP